MDAQGGRDQIDKRRFVRDLAIAKEFRARDVTAATMRFDALPVVDAL